MIVCIAKNLFFTQKIRQCCARYGLDLKTTVKKEELSGCLPSSKLVVLDLGLAGADPFELLTYITELQPDVRVVAFCPHVDKEAIQRAKESGVEKVVPRSKFFTLLPELLEQIAA